MANRAWVYSADGTKLRETVSTGITHDYLGGFFYKDGSLLHFVHARILEIY